MTERANAARIRRWITGGGLLLVALVLLLVLGRDRSPRPNIVLITADDLGYSDLGFLGEGGTTTPRLDAFFRENAAFLRHYTDATCQPTRAGLITGLHPSEVGFSPVGVALPDGVPTLAERLRDEGYRTEHVGKWHLGHAIPEATPTARGFDHYFGFLDQGFLRGPDADGTWRHRRPTHWHPWLGRDDEEPRQYEGHLTDLLTNHAVERIGALAGSDDPWFLNLWYYAPHDPLEPAARYVEEDTEAGRYRALVEHLDDAVGRVFDALDSAGVADRTVVVFLSDNGGTNRYMPNNRPLPGGKTGFFEGGIRTPMALRIPGRDGSRRIEERVSYLDLVPTLLELADAPADDPRLTGRSLLPVLDGEPLPPRPMFWEAYSDRFGYSFGVTSADGRWHYGDDIFTDAAMLSDLGADPTGALDRLGSPAYADTLRRLHRSYRAWHDRTHLLFEGRPDGDTVRHDTRDVQRTPGYNPVTWSFAVDPAAAAEGPVTVADQEGVGSVVVRESGVEARLFGEVLTGSWEAAGSATTPTSPDAAGSAGTAGSGEAARACHTVTLSTYAEHPNILSPAHLFRATLYVDGRTVAEVERTEPAATGHEHRAPLTLPPAGGALLGYRVWTEYLREEDSLRRPGVERVTEGICAAEGA